jgi:hypothetical protein
MIPHCETLHYQLSILNYYVDFSGRSENKKDCPQIMPMIADGF